jgi:hypothetical protein
MPVVIRPGQGKGLHDSRSVRRSFYYRCHVQRGGAHGFTFAG